MMPMNETKQPVPQRKWRNKRIIAMDASSVHATKPWVHHHINELLCGAAFRRMSGTALFIYIRKAAI